MRLYFLAGLLGALGAATNAGGQQVDPGQAQGDGWPESSLESRRGNPYDEIAAATGGSLIRLDPERDRDPALTAALLLFADKRSPLRVRTSLDVARGSKVVAFDISSSSAPLTVNVNGVGRGRVEVLRPDGRPIRKDDRAARLRTYGPDGSIGVFLQDQTPATGRWTIVVLAPAKVTIDVLPAKALVPLNAR